MKVEHRQKQLDEFYKLNFTYDDADRSTSSESLPEWNPEEAKEVSDSKRQSLFKHKGCEGTERIYESDDGYESSSQADQALANYAAAVGWTCEEIADLLVQRRIAIGADVKPHRGYYTATIQAALNSNIAKKFRPRLNGHGHASHTKNKACNNGKVPVSGQAGRAGRVESKSASKGQLIQAGQVGRGFSGGIEGRPNIVREVESFIGTYIVLPPVLLLVLALWIIAAWLIELFDRFPHAVVTSPEKRCGKTRLLQLLCLLLPNPFLTCNISTAALYRLIALKRAEKSTATLLFDEAQSLARKGSESAEQLCELLNAGIDRNSVVYRVGGESRDEIQEFPIYCPKVVALIGAVDGVLADRSLAVQLKRKTSADAVEAFRHRAVEPIATALKAHIEAWAEQHTDEVARQYDGMETLPIDNDRMAELLLPLQVILTIVDPSRLPELATYARSLDEQDRQRDAATPGVILLAACREIYGKYGGKSGFISTHTLINAYLVNRIEERWATWSRNGEPITPDALARLLKPYGIRSGHNKDKTQRGYYKHQFVDAWSRYLDTPNTP